MPQGTTNTRKSVFAITEREGKTYWTKIGVAYANRDGSITVNLEAFPVSGKLQIRDEEERRERSGGDERGRREYDERG